MILAGHYCEGNVFSSTHARIRAQVSTLYSSSEMSTDSLAIYPQTTALRTNSSKRSEYVLSLLNVNIPTYQVPSVWTQHHFVPVPKCERSLRVNDA